MQMPAAMARDFEGDVPGRERRVGHEGPGRGQGVGPARADGQDAVVGLDDVARARDQEGRLLVGHDHQGLELAEGLVQAPILGQLDGRPRQIALVFLELGLEAGEQGEGVRGGAGEAGQDLVRCTGGGSCWPSA